MLLAGRYAMANSPFLQGWQQEYMKAHGSMPPQNKVKPGTYTPYLSRCCPGLRL